MRLNQEEDGESGPVHEPWCEIGGVAGTNGFVGGKDGEQDGGDGAAEGVNSAAWLDVGCWWYPT